MAGKTRSDKNSVTAAVGSFSGAMASVPLPQGVELRSEEEMIIWEQFTRAPAPARETSCKFAECSDKLDDALEAALANAPDQAT